MVPLFRKFGVRSRPFSSNNDSVGLSEHCYTPLEEAVEASKFQFRLLRLLPGEGSDRVRCQLETVSAVNVTETHSYEAVSYCWGNSAEQTHILCDNLLLGVTTSVLDVLLELRHPNKARLLWIDQICINQGDLRERASQVLFMRLIYYKAKQTIVWLGKADAHTKVAIECARNLARIRLNLIASGENWDRVPDPEPILRRYGLTRNYQNRDIRAFWHLLQQDWFGRLWIIQEVVVSKSTVVVQGSNEIPWQDLVAASTLMRELRMAPLSLEKVGLHMACVGFIDVARQQVAAGKVFILRMLLSSFRLAKATDPRDKIFGILGLSEVLQDAENAPKISYNQSVEDVYRHWTIYILCKEQSLKMLSMLNRYESLGESFSCSWVPNYNHTSDEAVHHVAPWKWDHFSATPPIAGGFEIQDEGKILVLHGYFLDRIDDVGLEFRMSTRETIFGFSALAVIYLSQRLWMSWEKVARLNETLMYEHTGEFFRDAYWKTLLFGECGANSEETDTIRKEFEEFYITMRQPFIVFETWRLYWSKYLWAIFFVVRMLLRGFGYDGNSWRRGAGLSFTSRGGQLGNRRFIRTSNGYIGLAGYMARAGDHIALCRGARMPFVVRSTPSGWRLIGDVYLHGVMSGEAWRPEKAERLEIQ